MTRRDAVDAVFDRCKGEDRAALIAFLTAGFPDLSMTPALVEAACEGGADIIELGFPYSDPLADGPAIQASSQRALEAGATFDSVLDIAAKVKVRQPLIAFTYYNPLFVRGLERAASDLAAARLAGVVVPDLPPEESGPLETALKQHGLFLTFLVAPTTPPARAQAIAIRSDGFVYVVSRMGVTGTHAGIGAHLRRMVEPLRDVTKTPIAVGFGIANETDARAVAGCADGVIVGSALVQAASEPQPASAVRRLCSTLSAACSRTALHA
jgi:tryptophan synthase alpha chain